MLMNSEKKKEEDEDEDEDEAEGYEDGYEELDMPPPWSPKLMINKD